MAHKIQVKRGNKADLPTLDAGEFGLCQDTNELFIGNNGNKKIFPAETPTISDVVGLQSALDGKVDNARVLTDVPLNAKFTDTVTTINGKTGAIAKADITALGIPAQDTVYTHPTTAGNKHIPTGGASNQILKYSASGTAVWANESVTPVVDNLTSTDTNKALSANQGKVLNDLISNKSDKSVTSVVSLTAAGWVGDNAPYTRTYSNGAITTTNPVELFAPPDITAEQLEALQAANIQGGTQSAGSIVLRAFGEKPAIDIPVGFIVRGDL